MRQGNNPSVAKKLAIVDKTTNSEDLKNHVMPFPRYLVEGSPYARHTPQTIIPGKVNIEDPDKNKLPRL